MFRRPLPTLILLGCLTAVATSCAHERSATERTEARDSNTRVAVGEALCSPDGQTTPRPAGWTPRLQVVAEATETIEVRVLHDGQETGRCRPDDYRIEPLGPDFLAVRTRPQCRPEGWFRGHGSYRLEIRTAEETLSHTFESDDELEWVVVKSWGAFGDGLQRFQVEHVWRPPPGLGLLRAWSPRADGIERYRVVNHTTMTLVGGHITGRFHGYPRSLDDARSVSLDRAMGRANGGLVSALEPGGSAWSKGVGLLETPEPHKPGRYRYEALAYVVDEALPAIYGFDEPRLRLFDAYLLTDRYAIGQETGKNRIAERAKTLRHAWCVAQMRDDVPATAALR